jgi:chromosome segregation ATPase
MTWSPKRAPPPPPCLSYKNISNKLIFIIVTMEDIKDKEEFNKNMIKDTQMLIRNSMNQHKKNVKKLHVQIKKDKKTIDLYKEKIGKLSLEKEKLESKLNSKDDGKAETYEISYLKSQILKEVGEKKELEEKVREIKEDFIAIKLEMGGLNAISQTQEKYEKHIKILENRLDKANQKFNQCIEEDKKLREEIDKLRKERYFFENIYKRLEKELEKIREDISGSLTRAYDNYESRDKNQENFENIKAAMLKRENEYANILSSLANDINLKNARLKSLENKENLQKLAKLEEEENNLKLQKRINTEEQLEKHNKDLVNKIQELQSKFQKLEEFTGQPNIESFCNKFRNQAQENYDLFLKISKISKEAIEAEKEIKELEEEIQSIKIARNGERGEEKENLLNELLERLDEVNAQKGLYEKEYNHRREEFNELKGTIGQIFQALECGKDIDVRHKVEVDDVVKQSNARLYLSEIERKLKLMVKYYENEYMTRDDDDHVRFKETKGNMKVVNDNMRHAFGAMGKG